MKNKEWKKKKKLATGFCHRWIQLTVYHQRCRELNTRSEWDEIHRCCRTVNAGTQLIVS